MFPVSSIGNDISSDLVRRKWMTFLKAQQEITSKH